jgi:hypothetical protein
MKVFFILFVLLVLDPVWLFSQKEITTSWYHEVFDTFHSVLNNHRSCIPFDMVEVDDDVVIGTYDYFAWTVRRIDKKTGHLKWLTAQTPDYPDSTRKRYYLDNLFLRPDGNIDVLGVKSKFEELPSIPGQFGWGNPIKMTYNAKTGKRQEVLFPMQPNNTDRLVIKPGALGSYLPMEDGKGYYMMSSQNYPEAYTLTSLDTNLMLKDTLCILDYPSDVDKETAKRYSFSKPVKINEYIYIFINVWNNSIDSVSYQQVLYKIDLLGNITMRKKLGVPLYNVIYHSNYKPLSDGYLVYGLVDTTYTFQSSRFNTSMVAKVDTTGNIQWKTFLKAPNVGKLEIMESYEDKKRGGYWVMAGSLSDFDPYLFYIDPKGKSTFIANVNLSDNESSTIPMQFFGKILKDGSLFFSFQYKKAYFDTKYPKSYGVSMIDAADLDKALATSYPDVLADFLVKIYPNPAHDLLNINVLEVEDRLQAECYDLQGRLIYQCDFQNTTQINSAAWSRGLYAILIRDEIGRLVKTEKVILE